MRGCEKRNELTQISVTPHIAIDVTNQLSLGKDSERQKKRTDIS